MKPVTHEELTKAANTPDGMSKLILKHAKASSPPKKGAKARATTR